MDLRKIVLPKNSLFERRCNLASKKAFQTFEYLQTFKVNFKILQVELGLMVSFALKYQ